MKNSDPSVKAEPEPFVIVEETYGGKYKDHIVEQYKLCVEMADRVSSRRSTTNDFFLTLNSILITAIGVLSRVGVGDTIFNVGWMIVASIAGILFCWCWVATINGYRALNSAKFKVINSIEKRLPIAAFEAEWKWLLNPEGKTAKYTELTNAERWIPRIFMFLYIALIVFAILARALSKTP